jgi:hypothetical protein
VWSSRATSYAGLLLHPSVCRGPLLQGSRGIHLVSMPCRKTCFFQMSFSRFDLLTALCRILQDCWAQWTRRLDFTGEQRHLSDQNSKACFPTTVSLLHCVHATLPCTLCLEAYWASGSSCRAHQISKAGSPSRYISLLVRTSSKNLGEPSKLPNGFVLAYSQSVLELESHSRVFDLMGFAPSVWNKINIHVGGT